MSLIKIQILLDKCKMYHTLHYNRSINNTWLNVVSIVDEKLPHCYRQHQSRLLFRLYIWIIIVLSVYYELVIPVKERLILKIKNEPNACKQNRKRTRTYYGRSEKEINDQHQHICLRSMDALGQERKRWWRMESVTIPTLTAAWENQAGSTCIHLNWLY